jgi:hypothetical protein
MIDERLVEVASSAAVVVFSIEAVLKNDRRVALESLLASEMSFEVEPTTRQAARATRRLIYRR